jgi:alpha-ketoglutarate-dependent taurine dioxygenase
MNIETISGTGSSPEVSSGFQVADASPVLGAEIVGLDIRDDAAIDANWGLLTALLRDRHVLLFRDQDIVEADMGRLAMRFGAFERSVTQRPDGTQSEPVHMITNLDTEGRPSKTPHRSSNYFWHSDKAFMPTGSAMVMLYGVELPPKGGDTQFANMELAYEGLSDDDKALIADLRAIHSFEYMRDHLMKRPLTELERATIPAPLAHPLVRTDPLTGRKSLLLGMYACAIEGMDPAAGMALIQRLQAHATQERFVYTHTWRKGDFLAWNNLSTLHRALPNYEMEAHRRVMMRCGVKSAAVIQ